MNISMNISNGGTVPDPDHGGRNPSSLPLKVILLVDDRDELRVTMKWFLTNFGYEVDSARNAEEALVLFDPKIHNLVITDNSMPGMTGVEMSHIIKLRSPATPVVMFSGNPPADRSCLDFLIRKPAHLMELKEAVDKLMADRAPGPA